MNSHKHVSLNLNVRGMGQSATLAIKDRCRTRRQAGQEVFDFGLGQSPFPVPGPMVEALREHAREKDYLPVQGLPELREAVAGFHQRSDGVEIAPEHVLIGPGSKELMFLLQLVYYGEIIIPTPAWVTYLPQARIIGRRNSMIHASFEDDYKLSAAKLEEQLALVGDDHRPRLLILNYPSNPTGRTYTISELRELAEVARKYDLIVLSDEIYGQLHFQAEHASIARFYPEATIIASGISKWCGAGGWRLGTFAFPRDLAWLVRAMAVVASETYTSVSAPIQHAAIHAFRYGASIQQYLQGVRRILAAAGGVCRDILHRGGLRVPQPQGGFYLFVDFAAHAAALSARGVGAGRDLCERLLEDTGVAVLPGSAFGRSRRELSARLAFVDFDGAAALAASEALPPAEPISPEFVTRHCLQLVRGCERLAEWAARPA